MQAMCRRVRRRFHLSLSKSAGAASADDPRIAMRRLPWRRVLHRQTKQPRRFVVREREGWRWSRVLSNGQRIRGGSSSAPSLNTSRDQVSETPTMANVTPPVRFAARKQVPAFGDLPTCTAVEGISILTPRSTPTTRKVKAMDSQFDLLLLGGRVIDPASGRDCIADIGISAGRIAAIESTLPESAALQAIAPDR
jgi:hypothetical protein